MKKAMFIVSDELEADEEVVPATGLETTFSFQLTDEEYNELYRVWAHNEFYLDGHTCDWRMHDPSMTGLIVQRGWSLPVCPLTAIGG